MSNLTPNSYAPNISYTQSTSARMIEGGKLIDKPTLGKRFMMGLKKFGGMFAKIAGSVLRFFPGFGTIASSALYGLGDLAHRSYANSMAKDEANLALQEATANTDFQIYAPGFNAGPGAGASAPSGPQYSPAPSFGGDFSVLDTVLERDMAAKNQVDMMA